MERKVVLILGFLLSMVSLSIAQPPGTVSQELKMREKAVSEESVFEEDYESRIRKESLYGVYIPKDLGDAFQQLNQLTDASSRAKFTAMTETDARHKLHFSLGRWIIHNWGFYGGSRLTKYLNDIGIFDPDDMARFVIITYHRELNGRPLGVKELVEEFQVLRETERQKRTLEGEIIHEETRKRPAGGNK